MNTKVYKLNNSFIWNELREESTWKQRCKDQSQELEYEEDDLKHCWLINILYAVLLRSIQ